MATNIGTVFEARFPNLGKSLKYGTPDACVTQWSIKSDFLTPTDGWSLTFLDLDSEPTWFELQPVELYVDGRLQLLGRCDVSRRGGKDSLVELSGRDYLADLTMCSVDPSFTVRAGATLEGTLLLAMGPCGIVAIDGASERNSARTGGLASPKVTLTAKQLQDLKPGDGDSIFSWCNKIAARYALTIQPANRRNAIVLQKPSYGGTPIGKIISRKGGQASAANMLNGSGSAVRDYAEIPTYILTAGQGGQTGEARGKPGKYWEMSTVAQSLGEEFNRIVSATQTGRRIPKDVVGTEIDSSKLYRLKYFRDKRSRTQEEITAAAVRVAANALKASLVYSCELKGTTTEPDGNGYTWAPDAEVDVDDDLARVHERLWIASREFAGGPGGTVTKLECWRPGSFQIDPESNG